MTAANGGRDAVKDLAHLDDDDAACAAAGPATVVSSVPSGMIEIRPVPAGGTPG